MVSWNLKYDLRFGGDPHLRISRLIPRAWKNTSCTIYKNHLPGPNLTPFITIIGAFHLVSKVFHNSKNLTFLRLFAPNLPAKGDLTTVTRSMRRGGRCCFNSKWDHQTVFFLPRSRYRTELQFETQNEKLWHGMFFLIDINMTCKFEKEVDINKLS